MCIRDRDGLFTAEGPGGASGTLTASAGGQSQTITVSLENSHEDVPEGHWAYTAVDYCLSLIHISPPMAPAR